MYLFDAIKSNTGCGRDASEFFLNSDNASPILPAWRQISPRAEKLFNFSVRGNLSGETAWSGGKLLTGGFHWDMSGSFFVNAGSAHYLTGISPHHIRIECNVATLYDVLILPGRPHPISASPQLPKVEYRNFTKQPIQSGRALCNHQMRHRL